MDAENPEAMFHQIRPNYGADISDAEIRSVIRWSDRIPRRTQSAPFRHLPVCQSPVSKSPSEIRPSNSHAENAESAVERFLGGFSCTEADLWEASPLRLVDSVECDASLLLNAVYLPGEFINIVAKCAEADGKARPIGYGITRRREEWLSQFRENGVPNCAAGVWIRPNPTDGNGICDANTAAFRFTLLEFDSIPLALQLAFFARLPLPIAAIIASGGKSLHAWVKIAAENAEKYSETVSHLFRLLAPFGIDPANRNPARLSRLPGVNRKIGGAEDKRQRLLYLNPLPKTQPIYQ